MTKFSEVFHETQICQKKLICPTEFCGLKSPVNMSSKMNGTCEFLPIDNKYQTKAIHSADDEKHYPYPVVQAISLSTTFHQADPSQPKRYEYSRSANPNRDVLEECLALLDDGKYGLCFASGLGTITAIMHLFRANDHLICVDDVYGGTNRYFSKVASKYDFQVTFSDTENIDAFSKHLKSNTKLVWLESPTNPLMKVVDIEAICKIVHNFNKDIIIVVDNTFLTSYFQRPLNFGADVVVYSCTKYINGHSDVVMGAAITNNNQIYEDLKFIQNACGIIPSPFDCYLVSRSLKTLSIRMKTHMENGLVVGRFLEKHPMVEKVLHPGLPSHLHYEIAKRHWSGCSGMMSFYIKGGIDESLLFMKSLKYFAVAESLGGYESLVEVPSIMTHSSVPPEMRKELKISDNLIRLSVGLENSQDLVSDLDQALNIVQEKCKKG